MTPMVWHQGIHDKMGMQRMRREGVEGAPGLVPWRGGTRKGLPGSLSATGSMAALTGHFCTTVFQLADASFWKRAIPAAVLRMSDCTNIDKSTPRRSEVGESGFLPV